jgi:hypothetical protein
MMIEVDGVEAMLTTTCVATGQFEVRWNDQPTGYSIINGSLGLSGRDTRNTYGIVKPDGSRKWIGSLASCKKLLTNTFTKREKESQK